MHDLSRSTDTQNASELDIRLRSTEAESAESEVCSSSDVIHFFEESRWARSRRTELNWTRCKKDIILGISNRFVIYLLWSRTCVKETKFTINAYFIEVGQSETHCAMLFLTLGTTHLQASAESMIATKWFSEQSLEMLYSAFLGQRPVRWGRREESWTITDKEVIW